MKCFKSTSRWDVHQQKIILANYLQSEHQHILNHEFRAEWKSILHKGDTFVVPNGENNESEDVNNVWPQLSPSRPPLPK